MTVLIAHLADRAIIEIRGAETLGFLQDLVTADVDDLQTGTAAHSALLTPQGKILFDFFILAIDGGVLIDCAEDAVTGLVQKLGMYRLRRALTIARIAPLAVAAVWDDSDLPPLSGAQIYADPRYPELGLRLIATEAAVAAIANQPASAYQAHRYKLGIADAAEIGSGELFPHEACYDQFASVDFTKGCYVGQEVVSRMQHRGTARSRIVPVEANGSIPEAGSKILAGGKSAGTILGANAGLGLALVRLDRAAAAGNVLSVDGVSLTMHKPAWAKWADASPARGDED
jgi:folate-binding protein YgfZ